MAVAAADTAGMRVEMAMVQPVAARVEMVAAETAVVRVEAAVVAWTTLAPAVGAARDNSRKTWQSRDSLRRKPDRSLCLAQRARRAARGSLSKTWRPDAQVFHSLDKVG